MTAPKPKSAPEAITDAARILREAAVERRPCGPIRDLLEAGDVAGAYAIQEENTRAALAAGRRLVGRKIGLTSAVVQQAFGIDQPDYGMLFADMEVPDRGEVPFGRLLQPRVEGEVAFVLAKELPHEQPTLAEVIQAVDFVLPAIEIVDSRIAGWDIQLTDTIADNASSGLYVLGCTPRRLDGLDLQLCGMTLERNGEPAAFGTGLACMGHPLQAVRWLAGTMARVGRPLGAGDIVLSGALGPLTEVKPGDTIELQISGLGSAVVAFGSGQ